MNVENISAVDTAKLVRKVLKGTFPNQNFSVKTSTYSGGSSIDVRWADGPIQTEVEPIVRRYEGSGFDGSIDLKYSRSHWLRPDGSVLVYHDPGSVNSMGQQPAEDNRMLAPVMPEDAKCVRFMVDFIFCKRSISNDKEVVDEAIDWIYDNIKVVGGTGNPDIDRVGNIALP